MKRQKVTVPTRALVQRINRALRAEGKRLRSPRGRGDVDAPLGRYYLVDDRGVVATNVKPEVLAREVGVLEAWEEVR